MPKRKKEKECKKGITEKNDKVTMKKAKRVTQNRRENAET